MHTINTKKYDLRTDLVIDNNISNIKYKHNNISVYFYEKDGYKYSSVLFKDITDKDEIKSIEECLIKELNNYIDSNNILIVGLGNKNSTADALGPKVLEKILVTRHLFSFGNVEEGYSKVSIFEPSVFGVIGIDSTKLIKKVVELVNPDICILIDSLCTSSINRLNKVIQITDKGINPGSGVLNDRGELSKNTLNCKVIAIGVPTVVDMDSVIINILKDNNINEISLEDNLIVTPKEIDYLIDKLSYVIGNSINKVIHPIIRQNNSIK